MMHCLTAFVSLQISVSGVFESYFTACSTGVYTADLDVL